MLPAPNNWRTGLWGIRRLPWGPTGSSAPPTGVSAPRASRAPTDPAVLQQQLDGVVEAGAPGVVGLVRAGERTWQGASGLGDLRAERPARAGDRFRVGSVTKSFVATLVLQLVGEGRYTDDLPERHPGASSPGSWSPSPPVHKPLFAPGTQFSYSNTNYTLAGLLVERVTGQGLADQLQQPILQPLSLGDTELQTTQRAIAGPHARGYAPPDEDWQASDDPARLIDVTEMDSSWAWAAGAMVSTTADLARFYQALLGGQLLTPELLREMRTTVDASQLGHGIRRGVGLDRQLLVATNLQPEPEPGAATAAVENILRREVSC
jgi:D-alanyl-D-alanine carboxypeptidase